MIRQISFTATLNINSDNYEDWNPKSFDEAEDGDYDSIGRPLNHLTDEGWIITNKTIKVIKNDLNKQEQKIVKKLNDNNLIGFYIDPELFNNYVYFDPRYADCEGFYLLRIYKNEFDILTCDYEICDGYKETEEFAKCFHKYELEQILEMVDDLITNKDQVKTEMEYQKKNPNYWNDK